MFDRILDTSLEEELGSIFHQNNFAVRAKFYESPPIPEVLRRKDCKIYIESFSNFELLDRIILEAKYGDDP